MLKVIRQRLGGAVRQAGEALQRRSGQTQEQHSTQNNFVDLYDLQPSVGVNGFQAPNSVIAGEVLIGQETNVWHNAVIRGDLQAVEIGNQCVIGDECVISTCGSLPNGQPSKTILGDNVWVGPHSVIFSATVHSNCHIGANSMVLEGAVVEEGSVVGPNSVVPPGRVVPSHQLWAGNPVQYQKDLTKAEITQIQNNTKFDHQLGQEHKAQYLPYRTNYLLKQNDEDAVPLSSELTAQTLTQDQLRAERMQSDIYH